MTERLVNADAFEQTPFEKWESLFWTQFSFFKKKSHFVVAVFSDGLMEKGRRINETLLNLMAIK